MLVKEAGGLDVVSVSATYAESIERCRRGGADTMLLSLHGTDPDPAAIEQIRAGGVDRIVVLAPAPEAIDGLAGVDVVLAAAAATEDMWAALNGAPKATSSAPAVRAEPPAAATLTDRELDVLRQIGAGLTASEVGERLGISARTVDSHKQRIFAKLGVQNQAQAIIAAASDNAPRVALAGRDTLVRRAGRGALEASGLRVVADVASFSGLAAAVDDVAPDVVVTDVELDDGRLGPHLARLQGRAARVLLLCENPAPEDLFTALFGGASGYLLIDEASPAELSEAVAAVARGDAALNPAVAATILAQWRQDRADVEPANRRPADLTARELEVLQAMVDGLGGKAIANRYGLALKTVEHHKARIFSKLGARNQAQAVSIALAQQLVDAEKP
jgi:DNA-binding NarL/FixJ family response regulator